MNTGIRETPPLLTELTFVLGSGFSWNALLAVRPRLLSRDQFIYDAGNLEKGPRLSILIDVSGNLVFRVSEMNWGSHTVVARDFLFRPGVVKAFYLRCAYEVEESKAILTIAINNVEQDRLEVPQRIDGFFAAPAVIGANLRMENSASFVISQMNIYSPPPSEKVYRDMQAFYENHAKELGG